MKGRAHKHFVFVLRSCGPWQEPRDLVLKPCTWSFLKHSKSSWRSWDYLRKLRGTWYLLCTSQVVVYDWLRHPRRHFCNIILLIKHISPGNMINSWSTLNAHLLIKKVIITYHLHIYHIEAKFHQNYLKKFIQFNISIKKICISNDEYHCRDKVSMFKRAIRLFMCPYLDQYRVHVYAIHPR